MTGRPLTAWLTIGGWLQFGVLIAAVSYLSITPDPGESFQSVWDKLLHFVGWFGLALSLHFAWFPRCRFWRAALALWGYSVLLECIQHFSGREFSVADMLANAVGVIAALAVAPALDWLYRTFKLDF